MIKNVAIPGVRHMTGNILEMHLDDFESRLLRETMLFDNNKRVKSCSATKLNTVIVMIFIFKLKQSFNK